ncbi:hypothetical protein [Halobacteriovorax sp. DA5]|uniref:hypothetical protein n=1 Tax=Halobacteriovorax sp. DA5 TaxID=2067553 RepID=UPI000CD31806|nr:hypothetical protein [Halobacteriovorax sp. DA5]POB13341.1 hypothetical protein C0Z22_09260 [Halobacteriovorax sp. DA5]
MNESKKKKVAKFTIKALIASFVLPHLVYYVVLGGVLTVLFGPWLLYGIIVELDRPWYIFWQDRTETLAGVDENEDGIRDDLWEYIISNIGEDADEDIIKIWKEFAKHNTKFFSLDLKNKEEVYTWYFHDENLGGCVRELYENLETYRYSKTKYDQDLTLYYDYLLFNTNKRKIFRKELLKIGGSRESHDFASKLKKVHSNSFFHVVNYCSPHIEPMKLKIYSYIKDKEGIDNIILDRDHWMYKKYDREIEEFLDEYNHFIKNHN